MCVTCLREWQHPQRLSLVPANLLGFSKTCAFWNLFGFILQYGSEKKSLCLLCACVLYTHIYTYIHTYRQSLAYDGLTHEFLTFTMVQSDMHSVETMFWILICSQPPNMQYDPLSWSWAEAMSVSQSALWSWGSMIDTL